MVVDMLPDSLPLLLIAAGIGLSIAEAIAPGAHFIVLGGSLLGAGLLGLVLQGVLTGGALALVMALTIVVIGAISLFAYRELDLYGGKGTGRTTDSSSLKSKTGTVTERVTPTSGEVKLSGGGFNPYYQARSMEGEIAEGTQVIVTDPGGGNVVTVTSLETDDIDRELRQAAERVEEPDGGTENGDPEEAPQREREREREPE